MLTLCRFNFRQNKNLLRNFCTALTSGEINIEKDLSVKIDNNLKYIKGQTYMIRIEVAHPRDSGRIVDLLKKSFCLCDPLIKSLNIKSDTLDNLDSYFMKTLKDGLTVKAVNTTFPNEILGICVNTRNCKWYPASVLNDAKEIDDIRLKTLMHIWAIMSREPNLHAKFSSPNIFELNVLSVHPKAQLQGLGQKLVNSSIAFAKDMGFHYARMDCTSKYSARCAKKSGMDLVWEVPYDHLIDIKKQPIVVPDEPHTHIQVYALNLRRFVHKYPLPAINYFHSHHLHEVISY